MPPGRRPPSYLSHPSSDHLRRASAKRGCRICVHRPHPAGQQHHVRRARSRRPLATICVLSERSQRSSAPRLSSSSASMERSYWDRIRRYFSNLERLSIERASPDLPRREIRFAFIRELQPSAIQFDPDRRVPAPWPHLESLALITGIEGGDNERLSNSLVETLQPRAARGYRLAELRLVVNVSSEDALEGQERRTELYSDALQHLVDRLEFDVRVQEDYRPERDLIDVAMDYVRDREARAWYTATNDDML
ncbi:hypothetical protein C8Q80DRAFT_269096 [Daedaleopsis nitida]|nr:hypothetical protein C8Q80DRAFT_269096 [Daedaleopsis nitida]